MANTQWAIYRAGATAAGTQFLRLVFDENGGITKFEDNSISPEILGTTILLDGKTHATPEPSVSYKAGVYGAETEDASGITFEIRVKGFAAVLNVASASAGAVGTFDDETRTAMSGTFWYKTKVENFVIDLVGLTAEQANQNEEFDFVAERIVPPVD